MFLLRCRLLPSRNSSNSEVLSHAVPKITRSLSAKVVEDPKGGMRRAVVIDSSTGKPWTPPDSGWLSVKFKASRELPSIKVRAMDPRCAELNPYPGDGYLCGLVGALVSFRCSCGTPPGIETGIASVIITLFLSEGEPRLPPHTSITARALQKLSLSSHGKVVAMKAFRRQGFARVVLSPDMSRLTSGEKMQNDSNKYDIARATMTTENSRNSTK